MCALQFKKPTGMCVSIYLCFVCHIANTDWSTRSPELPRCFHSQVHTMIGPMRRPGCFIRTNINNTVEPLTDHEIPGAQDSLDWSRTTNSWTGQGGCPLIGASYYGPVSMGTSLVIWWTLWISMMRIRIPVHLIWKIKHGPKCTCRCSWYSCPIWSTPTRTSIHGGTHTSVCTWLLETCTGNCEMTLRLLCWAIWRYTKTWINQKYTSNPMGFFN